LYYLKSNAVSENMATPEYLKDKTTRLWQMRYKQVDMDTLQVLAIQEVFDGA